MELTRSRARLLRRIRTRRGREAEGVVLLEGPRVIETSLRHGAELLFAVVEKGSGAEDDAVRPDREGAIDTPASGAGSGPEGLGGLVEHLADAGVDVGFVDRETLRELADTETPQGVLAVARERDATPVEPARMARVLILDAIQDPGNAGALLRVAAALGVEQVLALDGTVDLWNPKVVRASAGHIFAVSHRRLRWGEALGLIRDVGATLVVGDPAGRDLREWADAAPPPMELRWALLVGNEGSGPRPEALSEADVRLAIPMTGKVDSLNAAVAGSILLWALGPGRDRAPSGHRDPEPNVS